jgi:regulator of sigma E protease
LIPIEQARPVGVIGISQIAQRSVEDSISTGAAYPILNILILVSVSLGIFNLLPIPALDGGRIVFAVVEKIRRKPLTPALEERIHMVTLMLLAALFVFITILDIVAPIQLP